MIAYTDQTDNNSGVIPTNPVTSAQLANAYRTRVERPDAKGAKLPLFSAPLSTGAPAASSGFSSTAGQYVLIAAVGFFIYFLWKHA